MFCEVRKKGAGSLTFTFHILLSSLLCLFFPDFCFVLVVFVFFFCGAASLLGRHSHHSCRGVIRQDNSVSP